MTNCFLFGSYGLHSSKIVGANFKTIQFYVFTLWQDSHIWFLKQLILNRSILFVHIKINPNFWRQWRDVFRYWSKNHFIDWRILKTMRTIDDFVCNHNAFWTLCVCEKLKEKSLTYLSVLCTWTGSPSGFALCMTCN